MLGSGRQPVALVGIDCKRGVELAPFASRLSALATDPEQAAELLPVLIRETEDRYDLIKTGQGVAPSTPDEEITSDIWGLPEHCGAATSGTTGSRRGRLRASRPSCTSTIFATWATRWPRRPGPARGS